MTFSQITHAICCGGCRRLWIRDFRLAMKNLSALQAMGLTILIAIAISPAAWAIAQWWQANR